MRTDIWMTLNALGNTGLQLYFIIQMVVEVVFFIYSCWIIYWFFRRRDIFPKFFVIMALAELGINVVFYIIVTFSATLRDVYPSGEAEMLKAVIRSVVFVAIWVAAIVRAEKVKDTFIRPYKYGLVEEEFNTTQENVMS